MAALIEHGHGRLHAAAIRVFMSGMFLTSAVGKFLGALVILNLIGMTIAAYAILKRKK